jgi:hypothetical protein
MRFPVPHGRVDPFTGVIFELFAMFAHEDGIGGTDFVSDLFAHKL